MTINIDITNDFIVNGTYLLSHSVGCPLRDAQANFAQKFFTPWESRGEPWSEWMAELDNFRQALSGLFHSDLENFCPQTNLSSALTKILFSIPKRKGKQKILLSEQDFPSLGFVAQQAKTLGYDLCFLPASADVTDPYIWEQALRADVQWVLITQVQSNTGVQVPVAEIVAAANRREIISVVDIAQSAGILPIHINQWNASFVIGSCIKWLCGGSGAGFLWVHPQLINECQPIDVGWFSHENPFEFDIHHFQYHSHALRFWGGTPSVAPYVLAAHSIQYLTEVGIDKIQAHNLALTQRVIEAIPPDCLISPHQPRQRSGTLILDFGVRQPEVIINLKQRHIQFDVRRFGIRLSPHIYTDNHNIDLVIDALTTPVT